MIAAPWRSRIFALWRPEASLGLPFQDNRSPGDALRRRCTPLPAFASYQHSVHPRRWYGHTGDLSWPPWAVSRSDSTSWRHPGDVRIGNRLSVTEL